MWMWRKLLKVSWTEMKNNIDVLNQVGTKKIMYNIIKERSRRIFGNLLRHTSFMTNIFESQINGPKGRGRQEGMYWRNDKTN